MQVFNIAETFRAKGIPCDGLHIDVDYADRYQTFTYNPTAFPDVYELFEVLAGKVRRLRAMLVRSSRGCMLLGRVACLMKRVAWFSQGCMLAWLACRSLHAMHACPPVNRDRI